MYQHKQFILGALFVLFFTLEAIDSFPDLIPASSPIAWLKSFGHFSPIALALLLLFIVKVSEHEKEGLERSLSDASGLLKELSVESSRVAELKTQVDITTKQIDDLASRLRSSDALLHGKLFFFQRQYRSAVEVFEEIHRMDTRDVEAAHWLGLSLLRDRQAVRAVPLLEFAAKERQNDPDLWYASGEAKFRMWNPAYFISAESDLQKAITFGLRQRESAQVLLAKLQLNRDRETAKATLRTALSTNPVSTPVIQELCRILFDEHKWNEVVNIVDTALVTNPRNWNLYPLRAQAFIRRSENGDFDRARADIATAKGANWRDFYVHRTEVELLLAQAKLTNSETDARSMQLQARDKITEAQTSLRGGYKAQAFAIRARISLLVGDYDDAVSSARSAVDTSVEQPHPSNHLLFCAALTTKRSWVLLSKTAQQMREIFPIPAIQVWADLYLLIAALCSNSLLKFSNSTTVSDKIVRLEIAAR